MRISTLIAALAFCLAAHAEDHKVSMANYAFAPNVVTVTAGDRVTWSNDDDSHHNVLFETPGMPDSPNIKPEKQYSAVFDKPGEYRYYCRFHRDNGMVGTLVVKPAGSQPPR